MQSDEGIYGSNRFRCSQSLEKAQRWTPPETHDRLLRALGRAIQLDEQERNRDLNTKAGVQDSTVGHPSQGPKVTLDKAALAVAMPSGSGLLFETNQQQFSHPSDAMQI